MSVSRATRAKLSAASKARWADPEWRAKAIAARRKADEDMVAQWKKWREEREQRQQELDELL